MTHITFGTKIKEVAMKRNENIPLDLMASQLFIGEMRQKKSNQHKMRSEWAFLGWLVCGKFIILNLLIISDSLLCFMAHTHAMQHRF